MCHQRERRRLGSYPLDVTLGRNGIPPLHGHLHHSYHQFNRNRENKKGGKWRRIPSIYFADKHNGDLKTDNIILPRRGMHDMLQGMNQGKHHGVNGVDSIGGYRMMCLLKMPRYQLSLLS